jgi:hypothetical protein
MRSSAAADTTEARTSAATTPERINFAFNVHLPTLRLLDGVVIPAAYVNRVSAA